VALIVLIHQKPSMTLRKVGRMFYTNQGSRPIGGGVEIWQGYFQSIRPTPRRMMVNIDLHATTFYESGSLLQLVVKLLGKSSVEDIRMGINEIDHTKLERYLKNLKIYPTHRGENAPRRRLRITKLTNTSASNIKFEVDGQQIDIATYFNNTYGRRLQYPRLPCIVARETIYFPMEVCNVVEVRKLTYINHKKKNFINRILYLLGTTLYARIEY
jgi:hypothetical protein